MAEKISLPDGGWALIRTPNEVPERLRRAYLEGQAELLKAANAKIDANGRIDRDSMDTTAMALVAGPNRDRLIHAYTKSWSLTTEAEGEAPPMPLPITLDNIMDLPGGVYDDLHGACEKSYKTAPNSGVVVADPADALDAASPTAPLAESGN